MIGFLGVAALVIVVIGGIALAQGRKACPRCEADLPRMRKPADRHEALWGGWTCRNCGAKLDRSGRPREA